MNDRRPSEREIRAVLDEHAPLASPDHLLQSFESDASRTRRYPRWLALIKEPTMRTDNHIAVGSPTARVTALLAATFLLAVALTAAGIAGTRLLAADSTIVVDQSGAGDVTTITEAVAIAEDGDTILVRPGTYDESVIVSNDITIRGEGDRADVIVEVSEEIPSRVSWTDRQPAAFVFEESDAVVENLTLRGRSSRIVIVGGAPTLRTLHLDAVGQLLGVDPDCKAYLCLDGIHITERSTATIEDGVFDRVAMTIAMGSSPTIVRNEFSVGPIWMEGTGEPYLEGNTFDSDGPWAIAIERGSRPTLVDNVIRGENEGITLGSDSGATILANTIEGSRTGLWISRGAGAFVEDNDFLGNEIAIGIASSDATIKDNVVHEGLAGIVSIGSESPYLEGNQVSGASGRGIAIDGSPTLVGNVICDNATNLWIADGAEPVIDETNEICPDAEREITDDA